MNAFLELGLSQPIINGIQEMGYTEPTPIQEKAIPQLLTGDQDMVGLAQTGTGKTAAFGLPLLDLVNISERHTQALVLSPTRELCLQISREFESFSKYVKGMKIQAVYGGADISRQIKEVKKGCHIIVATPGRLRDLMRRKVVNISQIQYVVLDEADEMLNMGFKEEIDEILEFTPDKKNTWLFSATMPKDVRRIAKTYMSDPIELSVAKENTSNKNIKHEYIFVNNAQKYAALKRFMDFETDIYGLIFTRTRMGAKNLADQLTSDGYNADALHGDMNQSQRDRVMAKFRAKQLSILVATDVAARGIDVQNITHVFNYNIPDDLNFYTHRSGRTGRAGKQGISLILGSQRDRRTIKRLEHRLQVQFTEAKIPSGIEICKKRLKVEFSKIKEAPLNSSIDTFWPIIEEELASLSKDELMKQIASMAINQLPAAYLRAGSDAAFNSKGNNRDRDNNDRGRGDRGKGRDRDRDSRRGNEKRDRNKSNKRNGARLFINIGVNDKMNEEDLTAMFADFCEIPSERFFDIKMDARHSFFSVEKGLESKLISVFDGGTFEGRTLRVNRDEPMPNRQSNKKGRKGKNRFSGSKRAKKSGFRGRRK